MPISRRAVIGTAAAAATMMAGARRARAQAKPVIRVGCLTDLSGPLKDFGGPVASVCARLAGIDFDIPSKDFTFEVVQADHKNDAAASAAIVGQWFDEDGVDAVVEVNNSSVALAVSAVAREKNKVFLCSGSGTSDLSGSACNANTIHWTYDTYMCARSTGDSLVRAGGRTWFFITADYAFGQALQRDCSNFVGAAGGKSLGAVAYSFPSVPDFTGMLRQADASGAQVLAICNSGAGTIKAVRQAREMGIGDRMTIAPMLMFVTDVHALGLPLAQGLNYSDSFYWDHNDRTRAFSKRLEALVPFVRPTMDQAGVYASTLHYLKTIKEMGAAGAKASGAAAVAAMKAMPADDDCFGGSQVRADGRCIHPSFLWRVKTPEESRYPWDYCELISQLPANEAFRPENLGGCSMIRL